MMVRTFALLAAVVSLATVGATAARADDATGTTNGQLLDVSKQVAGIQKKMNELLARGQQARAGRLLAGADCGYDPASQIFAGWGDSAWYALAPQGDLSDSDEWTLDKEAAVLSEGDPFSGAVNSLELSKGAEAATPAMCVNLDNPTLRFFARDVGGNGKANLKVDMLYENFDGHIKRLTIAKLKANDQWQPSTPLPIYMNLLAAASPSGVTAIALQFKAEGLQKDEAIDISGIYVDPYCSR
jgi:hypothetical protein